MCISCDCAMYTKEGPIVWGIYCQRALNTNDLKTCSELLAFGTSATLELLLFRCLVGVRFSYLLKAYTVKTNPCLGMKVKYGKDVILLFLEIPL